MTQDNTGAKSSSKKKKVVSKPKTIHLEPGDHLFKENERAESLYIIQRGQVRLFLEKGFGYVDIGILRKGEVIGEMSYFEEGGGRRSCSAAAITTTEVIEVSFKSLNKMFEGLSNIWFKTIVNTLVDRLRKNNARLKELEGCSVSLSKEEGQVVRTYKFFNSMDVIKLLALFHTTLKSFGVLEEKEEKTDAEKEKYVLKYSTLKFYALEIYNISEVKLEEFIQFLKLEEWIDLKNEPEKSVLAEIIATDIEVYNELVSFFNNQRFLSEDKQIKVTNRCEVFLMQIIEQLKTREGELEERPEVNISSILEDFKKRNMPIFQNDLDDAIKLQICDDIEVGECNIMQTTVDYPKLMKLYPCIKMSNGVDRVNKSKEQQGTKKRYAG